MTQAVGGLVGIDGHVEHLLWHGQPKGAGLVQRELGLAVLLLLFLALVVLAAAAAPALLLLAVLVGGLGGRELISCGHVKSWVKELSWLSDWLCENK